MGALQRVMRPAVLAAALVAAAVSYCHAHSALDRFWGEVPVDMLLTGDVLIVRTLVVPEDVTLTIDPGTTVRFEDTGGTNGIIVRGRLVAAGNPGARIRFVPRDEKSGRWRGIIFEGGSGMMSSCDVVGAGEGVSDPGHRVRLKDVETR